MARILAADCQPQTHISSPFLKPSSIVLRPGIVTCTKTDSAKTFHPGQRDLFLFFLKKLENFHSQMSQENKIRWREKYFTPCWQKLNWPESLSPPICSNFFAIEEDSLGCFFHQYYIPGKKKTGTFFFGE